MNPRWPVEQHWHKWQDVCLGRREWRRVIEAMSELGVCCGTHVTASRTFYDDNNNNKTVFTVHFRPSNGPETARQVRGGRGEQPPRNLGSNHQRQAGRRPETSEVKGRTGTPDAGGANDKHRKPAHQKSVA